MKKTIILMILFFVTVVTFGQVVEQDSTGSATVVYTFGDSLMQFLSKNWATIAFTLLFVLSEWLGQTGKVKEGSVWAWIINLVLKLFKSKATGIQTKKAVFMSDDKLMSSVKGVNRVKGNHFRTIILICLLSGVGMSISAQSVWKPLPKDLFKILNSNLKQGQNAITHTWLWRIDGTFAVTESVYNSNIGDYQTSVFSGVGPTFGINLFVPKSKIDPTPYNILGFSGGILVGTDFYNMSLSSLKAVIMAKVFEYAKFGVSYTPNTPAGIKHFGFIIGGSVNFNK
jgi:hypothetical protein